MVSVVSTQRQCLHQSLTPSDPMRYAASEYGSLLEAVESIVYDIVPRGTLPSVDATQTVKSWLLPPPIRARLNRLLKRHAFLIAFAYFLGIVCRAVSVFARVDVARAAALASVPLQLPAIANVAIQFRVEFLQLLLTTYDFWFYLAMNAIWASCFAWYFSDARIAMLPLMWIDVQNATLLDSFLQDFQKVVSAVWLWCVFLFIVMVAVSLDAVDGVDATQVLFETRRRTITVKEVLLNAIGTILILSARVLYRKRAALRSQQSRSSAMEIVQTITFAWPIKLQPRERDQLCSATTQLNFQRRQTARPTELQLFISIHSRAIHARDIVWPWVLRSRALPRYLARSIGIVGFVATPAVLGIDQKHHPARLLVASAAVVCTTFYCGMLVCVYQRKLLARLLFSFDFAFISLQLSAVHMCVADTFRWEPATSLCVLSSWMWMHSVLTVDALTPAMRRLLGFRSWFQIPVMLWVHASAMLLWLELSQWDSQGLFDRRFLHVGLGSHSIQLHVVPFLLSRLLTVSLWGWRMLYRIAKRESDHDLMCVQSPVEFDGSTYPRKAAKMSPKTRISPSIRRGLSSKKKSVGQPTAANIIIGP